MPVRISDEISAASSGWIIHFMNCPFICGLDWPRWEAWVWDTRTFSEIRDQSLSSQHLTRVSFSSTPPRARLLLLFQVLVGDIEEKTMFLPVLVSSCAYCHGFFYLFIQQVFIRNLTHTTMTRAFCGRQMDGMPPPGAHNPGLGKALWQWRHKEEQVGVGPTRKVLPDGRGRLALEPKSGTQQLY